MADITINFKDHVHCRVHSNDVGILQEISDYFTFEQPGARFMPQFRAKLWDGKVRLYSMFTQELYVGLKSYLEHFCKERDYTIDYSEYVDVADKVTYEQVKEFCKARDS